MNANFKLDPQLLYKFSQGNLLLVSMTSDNNEVYKFSGLSSEILKSLFDAEKFNYLQAEKILRSKNILDNSDLDNLWKFCIDEKIISPAS